MKDLDQKEWQKLTSEDNNSVILDVRTQEEVEQGYIPNAKNIDIYDASHFMEEINKLDKEKNYYIYCKSGGRSAQACAVLDQMGFKNTFNLLGGFSEWKGERAED